MRLVGYTNLWTVRPGETLTLHVSCAEKSYNASVVRLRHGDTNPAGPGFIAEGVPSDIDGQYTGTWHDVPSGSYAIVDDAAELLNTEGVSVAVWICPTAPGSHQQAIIARDELGFRLSVGTDCRPMVSVGSLDLAAPDALVPDQWYLLIARLDRRSGAIELLVRPRDIWPTKTRATLVSASAEDFPRWRGPLLMAARPTLDGTTDHFNGKIDSPQIFSQWLSDGAVDALAAGNSISQPQVAWDFGADQVALTVPDQTGHFPARLIGMPTRAVTGYRWYAKVLSPSEQPQHYTAIHFHDDDRDDAGWPEALRLSISAEWPSGIYAFSLETNTGDEDYVPFFVLPRREGPFAPVAFLAPTFSYLAYGNAHFTHCQPSDLATLELYMAKMPPPQAQDVYVREQQLDSCYDLHSDGSGVAYVSRLLPQVHVRPKVNFTRVGPHQFNADLHLVDWLHAKEFRHDVLTDEALHHEGVDLLRPYRVVLTGTHPEYWSGAMLDALQAYLNNGGRVMYLGGNGFYWVTSVHPHAPHVIEVRKTGGTHTWEARAGERHHSSTGECGGLWRNRGRAPQKLVAVGMAGEGYSISGAYRRTPASYSDVVAFMFEGITTEVIGDTPSLVMQSGAAGFEVDRIDFALGSPPNTICVAQSFGLSADYALATEDILAYMQDIGPNNPLLRADIAYAEYPEGGAIFSVGSITYCASLSYNGYHNEISRLTENVLRKFSEPQIRPQLNQIDHD